MQITMMRSMAKKETSLTPMTLMKRPRKSLRSKVLTLRTGKMTKKTTTRSTEMRTTMMMRKMAMKRVTLARENTVTMTKKKMLLLLKDKNEMAVR